MSSRKCHVIKKDSEEFEFFLKVDQSRKGQIITSVTKDGPAYRAGLKDGDRIIEINGTNVESKDHATIVGLIRECIPHNEITFLVIDVKNDPNIKKPSSSPKKKSSSEVDAKPRVCKIKKKNNSFGFYLEAHGESDPGHFIKQVTKGGAADGTGLLVGDRIIAVGKTNVESESHQHVVNLIKKSGQKITLLVIDDEAYRDLKERGIPITEKLAKGGSTSSSRKSSSSVQKSTKSTAAAVKQATSDSRGKVRVIHVLKHPDNGYGFYLRSKKNEEGEFVGDVDKKGCADVCGLLNDDRVVAVNGQSIIGMSHGDVIGLVKAKQSQFVFVVMDKEAMEKFRKDDSFPSKDDITHSHTNIIRTHQLTKGGGVLGMSLRLDKGRPFHVISDIETDGVAERAGLKEDDILIAVGDNSVLRDSHEECIQKIKNAGDSMEFTVGDRKAAGFVRDCGVTFSAELVREWPTEEEMSVPSFGKSPEATEESESSHAAVKTSVAVAAIVNNAEENDSDIKPRICRIKRHGDAFGFFLKDDNGHFLTNVEKDGPASQAGVLEYDRIIEINGENVEKKTHNEVVNLIRQTKDVLTFLVVNEQEHRYFKEKGIAITSAMLYTGDIPDEHRPRLCHLTRSSTAYGFHLTGDGDRDGQFIREILPGGAADLAGVREGDLLVEVNGVNVLSESHDTIVKKVTEKENEVTFLVIDKEGEEYYKRKGIVIAASLVVAKDIAEEVIEKNKGDDGSIGGSASSSIIETEATVHKEDVQEEEKRDVDVADVVEVAAAAAIIHEVVENEQERREEEIREEMKQDLVESLTEKVEESEEETDTAIAPALEEIIDDKLEEEKSDEDLEIGKKAAIAVVAAVAVEEVLDEVKEDSRPPTPESPLLAEKEEESVAEKIEEIVDEIREENEEKESAVEAAQEIIEEVKEEEPLAEVISNHVEDMQEDDTETVAKKAAAALIANEIRDRYSDKNSDSESAQDEKEASEDGEEQKHEEQAVNESPVNEIEPEFVATAAAVAVAVARAETPEDRSRKSSISEDEEPVELVKGKIVKESTVVEPPAPKSPEPKPLASIVTQTVKEAPKWQRPAPEPEKEEPFRFGQNRLKPVKRFPEVQPAQTPPSTPNDVEESAPVRSSVAAMRAQFEKKSQKQQLGFANAVQDELAQLSRQKGEAGKRIQMFGGGKTPKENGQPQQEMKKQFSWTGQGMSIKIVES